MAEARKLTKDEPPIIVPSTKRGRIPRCSAASRAGIESSIIAQNSPST